MWQTEEFGAAHEGRPGVLVADGTEPKPVIFDVGSGPSVHRSSDWWVYDGTLGAPRASEMRAVCSCGWRGDSCYPLDWDAVDRRRPELFDTSGPEEDWDQHIAEVDSAAVPVPKDVLALLTQVEERLDALAGDEPLAALRAIATLERAIADAGRTAACHARADARTVTEIGRGLGLPARDARSRLLRYTLPR
ncbi:hypothetical protein ABZ826_23050 [Streptomyces sp. NPDC047515]|uniref:hypothetical protein n=1 Tax=Streptomyces sp. NPDC047515 TaxID=3155380 RepID=UPI0033DC5153